MSGLVSLLLLLPGVPEGAGAQAFLLLEAGDYPRAEEVFRSALDGSGGAPPAEQALLWAGLADSQARAGALDAAGASIARALGLSRSPAVLARAARVYLRALRFEDLLSVANELRASGNTDPELPFLRGVALSKLGRAADAVRELEVACALPGRQRDARLELALARAHLGEPRSALRPLREILEVDPFDAEAVYQASRQLLRAGGAAGARFAAALLLYFDALRRGEGASSEAEHLAQGGKVVLAALERAARRERLGDFEGALAEAARPASLPAGEATAREWVAAFHGRRGFRVEDTEVSLAAELERALAAGDEVRSQAAARLLLTRNPRSTTALRALVEATRAPELAAPRLHYLARLSALLPGDPALAGDLLRLRASFEGEPRGR